MRIVQAVPHLLFGALDYQETLIATEMVRKGWLMRRMDQKCIQETDIGGLVLCWPTFIELVQKLEICHEASFLPSEDFVYIHRIFIAHSPGLRSLCKFA